MTIDTSVYNILLDFRYDKQISKYQSFNFNTSINIFVHLQYYIKFLRFIHLKTTRMKKK